MICRLNAHHKTNVGRFLRLYTYSVHAFKIYKYFSKDRYYNYKHMYSNKNMYICVLYLKVELNMSLVFINIVNFIFSRHKKKK